MTIKKRLFWSNILMIAVPVIAALAAVVCCIALLWLMLQNGGGLPLEDSGDFSWASRAAVKLASRSLEKGKALDALGETLQVNGLRLTVLSGGETVYTWGGEQPDDARLLQAAESLGGTRALVSAGEHSLSITHREINGTGYQIRVYGTRSEELPSGLKLVIVLAGLVLLCAVLAAIWGTNRFLIRFVFQKINGPLVILSDGVREIGQGNLDYRIDYREKDEFAPVCQAFNEMAARLKASVERTRQDEESRKELLAGISHDLRSPLTSIRAYVEGLLDGVARTDEAQRRYLATIKTKAEDIDRMVSQLFLFSKLDMAEYPMEPRTLRLDEFVTALAAETGEEYQSKGLDITVESLCPVRVTADGALLRRVLTNIMDNSAKYKVADAGRLRISVEDAGQDCRVVLTDDGPGVPEETLPKLFDAFYRSDPARKNPAGGSGLGLALGLSGRFDLILLDLMLPVVDGFTVCRKLREEIDTPILMVTARREDVDKIRGLGLGADDYIEKPFSPSVLAARVKAHLARYERLTGGRKQTAEIHIGGLSLHTDTRRLYVEGREVELKNREYELLLFFLLHVDIVFSREELYEKIWGLEAMGDNATVASISTACGRRSSRTPPSPGTSRRSGARDTGSGDNKIVGGIYP